MPDQSIQAYRDQVVRVAVRQAKAPRRRCRICKQSRPTYLIQSHEEQCRVAVRQYRECNAAWGNINTGEHHECMLLNGHACEHRCKCGATR